MNAALRPWLLAARPRTLPAGVVPVAVGSALAHHAGAFDAGAAAVCLAFALLVQVGTNFANDYFDFVHGTDLRGRVGPTRAVAAGLVTPRAMRVATTLVFALALAVGLLLIPLGGWGLLPLGLLCIACGVAYTGGPYPLAYHGWGDVFVFIFFGLVAVGATFYVQAGSVTPDALLAGAAVGLLATNLLVANNYRDRAGDAASGKRTLVVRWGERAARWQYGLSLLAAAAVPGALAARGLGNGVLLAWLAMPLGLIAWLGLRPDAPPAALIGVLGRSAAFLLLYGTLLAAGLVLGAR